MLCTKHQAPGTKHRTYAPRTYAPPHRLCPVQRSAGLDSSSVVRAFSTTAIIRAIWFAREPGAASNCDIDHRGGVDDRRHGKHALRGCGRRGRPQISAKIFGRHRRGSGCLQATENRVVLLQYRAGGCRAASSPTLDRRRSFIRKDRRAELGLHRRRDPGLVTGRRAEWLGARCRWRKHLAAGCNDRINGVWHGARLQRTARLHDDVDEPGRERYAGKIGDDSGAVVCGVDCPTRV